MALEGSDEEAFAALALPKKPQPFGRGLSKNFGGDAEMPKPRDFQELKRKLEEQGDDDIAEAILPLDELAPPEIVERYPMLKNFALVALSELTDEEIEDIYAEWEGEEGEPKEIRRIIGMPNLTEKASMCDLVTFDDLLRWLEQNGIKFE